MSAISPRGVTRAPSTAIKRPFLEGAQIDLISIRLMASQR